MLDKTLSEEVMEESQIAGAQYLRRLAPTPSIPGALEGSMEFRISEMEMSNSSKV